MAGKLESNNGGREKKDYIKEALEYTGKELAQLQRASFVEKTRNGWRYKLDAAKKYLEGVKNDNRYLNLSRNKTTTVMATQIALFKAGYMQVGSIDAKWGPQTMGCIKKFQKENGLIVSGYLNKKTVEKLLAVAEKKQNGGKVEKPDPKKKEEEKKQNTPAKKKTPSNPTPTPEKKTDQSSDFIKQDSTKLQRAVADIGGFDLYGSFQIKDGKEISKGNKKFLKILGAEYEELPVDGLSAPENNTSKNWYHNGNDYFIFGKFINGRCYNGVKISGYKGGVLEKGSFDINGELEEKNGKRVFLNAEAKGIYEHPDPYPGKYNQPV